MIYLITSSEVLIHRGCAGSAFLLCIKTSRSLLILFANFVLWFSPNYRINTFTSTSRQPLTCAVLKAVNNGRYVFLSWNVKNINCSLRMEVYDFHAFRSAGLKNLTRLCETARSLHGSDRTHRNRQHKRRHVCLPCMPAETVSQSTESTAQNTDVWGEASTLPDQPHHETRGISWWNTTFPAFDYFPPFSLIGITSYVHIFKYFVVVSA